MKRIIGCVFVMVAAMLLVAPGTAIASQGDLASGKTSTQITERCYDADDIPYLNIGIYDTGQVQIAQYLDDTTTSLVIPEYVKVDGKSLRITGVDDFAFQNCTALTTIDLPASITIIEEGAFEGCTNLTSVTGCAGVKTIETEAFHYCPNMSSFAFGKNLRLIENRAFATTKITASSYPSYLVKLDDGSYRACDARLYVRGKDKYSYAYKVLDQVNKERTSRGLQKLTMDKDLMKAAMQRAAELSIMFSHTRPMGDKCFSACSKMMGENAAIGQISPSTVMSTWMNSPGHKANILGSSYKTIGIGCFYINGRYHWIQAFGTGSAAKASKPKNKTATHTVDCNQDVKPFKLKIKTASVKKGKKTALNIVYQGSSGSAAVPVQAKGFKFSTSNKKVATVNAKGKVTGKKRGKAKITARAKVGTAEASRNVKVK